MEIIESQCTSKKNFKRNLDIKFSPVKFFHAREIIKLHTETFFVYALTKIMTTLLCFFHQDRSLMGSVSRM